MEFSPNQKELIQAHLEKRPVEDCAAVVAVLAPYAGYADLEVRIDPDMGLQTRGMANSAVRKLRGNLKQLQKFLEL